MNLKHSFPHLIANPTDEGGGSSYLYMGLLAHHGGAFELTVKPYQKAEKVSKFLREEKAKQQAELSKGITQIRIQIQEMQELPLHTINRLTKPERHHYKGKNFIRSNKVEAPKWPLAKQQMIESSSAALPFKIQTAIERKSDLEE